MDKQQLHINRLKACEAIENEVYDFTAKYYAAYELNNLARQNVRHIDPRTIDALKSLLLNTAFNQQRQRRFLFREAATVLSTVVHFGGCKPIAKHAYKALLQVLYRGRDHAHQAAAEALGALPLGLHGAQLPALVVENAPNIHWSSLLAQPSFSEAGAFTFHGRSLTAPRPGNRIAVVKFAKSMEDGQALRQEIQWMEYIAELSLPGAFRFDVPKSLRVNGAALFRLKGLPAQLKPTWTTDSDPLAIGFVATDRYYGYPNDGRSGALPDGKAFLEIMGRNAYLLGWLAGQGIVHLAPIPLFHNRVQQSRRRDGGTYEWFRAGRLDRWLESCAYPNFGQSGLRDFEHFVAFNGKEIDLFRHMGNHLLSLLLVAGSYFRAKDIGRSGRNPDGSPVDARDLFDRDLLSDVVHAIYRNYHDGFVGKTTRALPPMDLDRLVYRMVEEMGVDRHMEEILRVVDQQQMTPAAFEAFLKERGFKDQQLKMLTQGTADLVIDSGPHLGGFNRAISLPEIIEAAAAMAAACKAERFVMLNTASGKGIH